MTTTDTPLPKIPCPGYTGDPLSEPTRARRLHAAISKAGYTMNEFARELGVRWQTLQEWTLGSVPNLDSFVRACELVGYTPNDIHYGYERRVQVHTTLDEIMIRRIFDELHVAPQVRAAFARFQDSPDGRYQEYSRAYVTTWLDVFATEFRHGANANRATERAATEALQAHALAIAVSEQVRPVDTSDLRDMVQAKPARARKRRLTGEHETGHRPANAHRRVAR